MTPDGPEAPGGWQPVCRDHNPSRRGTCVNIQLEDNRMSAETWCNVLKVPE